MTSPRLNNAYKLPYFGTWGRLFWYKLPILMEYVMMFLDSTNKF